MLYRRIAEAGKNPWSVGKTVRAELVMQTVPQALRLRLAKARAYAPHDRAFLAPGHFDRNLLKASHIAQDERFVSNQTARKCPRMTMFCSARARVSERLR
jgi:hypothetical protein